MITTKGKKIVKPTQQVDEKRKKLTDEDIEDTNFFLEDLQALDEEIKIADDVYNEIHGLYANLTGGEYVPTRNLRDIAELAKNMISARSYHADAVNKRIALKKTIVDLKFRANGGIDENSSEMITNYARQIVSTVRQEAMNDSSFSKPKDYRSVDKRTSEGKKQNKEELLLEKALEEKIKSGEIVLGKNDKLVGTNDYIVTRFDPSSNKMVAVDSRNGKVIEDFPENRLPESKISRKDEETVTLFDGSEIKIYDSLEFDDGYVDDGD